LEQKSFNPDLDDDDEKMSKKSSLHKKASISADVKRQYYNPKFNFHTEDLDLGSLAILYWGAPKVWWIISPLDRAKFEALYESIFPKDRVKDLRPKLLSINPIDVIRSGINITQVISGSRLTQNRNNTYLITYWIT
jgi:JmjC domain, hydroxylase